jgi:hypothetical protein
MRELKKMMEQFILTEKNSAKIIELLKEENTSLRTQNELLFNKLMAKDFEQYAIFKSETEPEVLSTDFDPYADDSLAGDIIDETEQPTITE